MYLHKDHKIGVISNHLKEKKKSNIQTVFVKKKIYKKITPWMRKKNDECKGEFISNL
jgi:hypothetical protein